MLKVDEDQFITATIANRTLPANLNGQTVTLTDQIIRYTFFILSIAAHKDSIPFINIIRFYENNITLLDQKQQQLNIPSQYCNGGLKRPLISQTIQFAIFGDYSLIDGRCQEIFAPYVPTEFIDMLGLPNAFFNGYTSERLPADTVVVSVNVSSFSFAGPDYIGSVNETFFKILATGIFNLFDQNGKPLRVSNVDNIVVSKVYQLIVLAPSLHAGANQANFSDKISKQITDSINISAFRFSNRKVDVGQLVSDPATNVVTSLARFTFNFTINYTGFGDKVSLLKTLVANNSLLLNDLQGNRLLVPADQDLKSTFSHPLPIRPLMNNLSSRAYFDLSCSVTPQNLDATVISMAKVVENQLNNRVPFSQIYLNSSFSNFETSNQVCNRPRVSAEQIKMTILNDYDSLVGDDVTNFIDFIKPKLTAMLNTSIDTLISVNVNRVNYSGPVNGSLGSQVLFSGIIQLSFVKLSNKQTNDSQILCQAQRLVYNNDTLFIPKQYKNGSTENTIENYTISFQIMCNLDVLVEDNVAGFKDQLRQHLSATLQISTDFFKDSWLYGESQYESSFHLTIVSYHNESVIDIRKPIVSFYKQLSGNNMKIRDITNYPVHILTYKLKHTFIILQKYSETAMKNASVIIGFVLLFWAVIKSEFEGWLKRRKRKLWASPLVGPAPAQIGHLNQVTLSNEAARQSANTIAAELALFENAVQRFKSIAHVGNQCSSLIAPELLAIGKICQLVDIVTSRMAEAVEQHAAAADKGNDALRLHDKDLLNPNTVPGKAFYQSAADSALNA